MGLVPDGAHTIELHAEGKVFALRSRQGFIMLSPERSRFVCQPMPSPVIHLHFQRSSFKQLAPELERNRSSKLFRRSGFALRKLALAFASDLSRSSVNNLILETYATLFVRRLWCNQGRTGSFKAGLAPWQARRATEYLQNHFNENVSLI